MLPTLISLLRIHSRPQSFGAKALLLMLNWIQFYLFETITMLEFMQFMVFPFFLQSMYTQIRTINDVHPLVFRFEVVLLLIVYLAYGYNDGGAIGYILLSISSWFMALSWLFAPYLFNPSAFEWQK